MKPHTEHRTEDASKDHFLSLCSVSVSHHSFAFVHGFVFCLLLKNLCRHVGSVLSCSTAFDKYADSAAAAEVGCVFPPPQSGLLCTGVKEEGHCEEQEAPHAGLECSPSHWTATASQEVQTNAAEDQNQCGGGGKDSPVNAPLLHMHLSGDGFESDVQDDEQLTDAYDYPPNDLLNVKDDWFTPGIEKRKLRTRKQSNVQEMPGVTETGKRRKGRQANEAHKSTSKVIHKSKVQITGGSKSLFAKTLKTAFSKKLKTSSKKPSSNISRKSEAISVTYAGSDTAVKVDDVGGMDSVIAPPLFSCDTCNKTFTSAKSCKRHAVRVHLRNRETAGSQQSSGTAVHAQCDQCPKVYTGGQAKKNLHQHVLAYHSEMNPVQCDVCNVMVNNEHHLKLHKRSSHRKDVCYICGAHFVTQIGLQTHLLAHKGDKSYVCEICGAAFVRESSLRQHTKFHTDSRDFQCGKCPLSFKTFSSLSIHMMCVHQCGSYFSSQVQKLSQLGYMIDGDSAERLHSSQCVTCGQDLVDSACPLHSSDCLLSFSCPQCQWTTKDIQKFRKHLAKRNNATVCSSFDETKAVTKCGGLADKKRPSVKNFVCPSCGKQFFTQSHLQNHKHQHTEKRFSCPVCEKGFTYKFNMQKHLTIHTDTRPFECHVCQKTFKMKSELQLHQRYHDGEFKCEICGKVLTRRQHVTNHYKLVHPETQTPE